MSTSHTDYACLAGNILLETQITFYGVTRDQNKYSHEAKFGDMKVGVRLVLSGGSVGSSNVGLFLRIFTDGEIVPVTYRVTIMLHRSNSISNEGQNVTEVCTEYRGCRLNISADSFLDPQMGYCVDGKVVAKIKITLRRAPKRKLTLCSNSLNIEHMLFDDNTSDFRICVDGQVFPVHKLVLSLKSPVFAVMFKSQMTESTSNTLTITDFSAAAVKAMIRCLYNSSEMYDEMFNFGFDLLALGSKYGMEPMVECASDYLQSTLDVRNAVKIILLAELHSCNDLKKRCLHFMKNNIKELSDDSEFVTQLGAQLSAELMRTIAGVA